VVDLERPVDGPAVAAGPAIALGNLGTHSGGGIRPNPNDGLILAGVQGWALLGGSVDAPDGHGASLCEVVGV
jgi:hypothetical protein